MDYILMNLETVADGFLLTLGLHVANILIAIVETLIVCLLVLAFYLVFNVAIRLIAWRHNRMAAIKRYFKTAFLVIWYMMRGKTAHYEI